MALSSGDRIGHYEIVSLLGKGGMGEVYRAHDARLRRSVAIKILPEGLGADRDRWRRFEREATALASLNHPNIAQVYGLEETAAGRGVALVMELIEGEELSRRIGSIAVPDAIKIAAQVASALEAAHAAGMIHRDLKPANIMVRTDGAVRVLDFGLAKVEGEVASPALTTAGVILGTVAYMAPEQASGKPVDKRCDVWAFGCVLFEMLAGQRAFDAASAAETLAQVIEREPNWDALPASTPTPLRALLRKCLQKDPARRLRDIADAHFDLDESCSPSQQGALGAPPRLRPRDYLPWAVAVAAIVIATGIVIQRPATTTAAPEVTRFGITLPAGRTLGPTAVPFAMLSPDGKHLAFIANADGYAPSVWVRTMADADARELPGTTGASSLFWSADGHAIAFVTTGRLMRTTLTGAAPELITKVPLGIEGASWSPTGTILFGSPSSGIFSVAGSGGDPVQLTKPTQSERGHHWPIWLTDRQFLFHAGTEQVFLASTNGEPAREVLKSNARVEFVAPSTLFFVRGADLMAQSFDPERAELGGEPVRIVEQLRVGNLGRATYSASQGTSLMYAQRTTGMQVGLQVLEKNGQPIRQLPLGQVRSFALSPDGTSLAVHAHDSNAASGELWIVDVARGTLLRIDNGSAHDDYPVWSPDGTRLAVSSGGLAIVTVGANSAREQLISQLEPLQPSDWSSDGKWLIYQSQADPDRGFDIWAMPMSGDRKPQAVVNTGQDERGGVLSPNGQWLAYTSGESGRPEIYLQPFPPDGRKIPVSASGGSNARWGSDGVLYYWSIEGAIMRAELDKLGSSLRLTAARPVFKTQSISTTFTSQANRAPYDVLPADRGYVSVYTPPTQMESPLMILLNWRTLYGSAKP